VLAHPSPVNGRRAPRLGGGRRHPREGSIDDTENNTHKASSEAGRTEGVDHLIPHFHPVAVHWEVKFWWTGGVKSSKTLSAGWIPFGSSSFYERQEKHLSA